MFRSIISIGNSFKRNSRLLTGFQVKRRFYDADKFSENAVGVTLEEEKRERADSGFQIPLGFIYLSKSGQLECWSARHDLEWVLIMFAKWRRLYQWYNIKELFDLWLRFSKNKPDVNLVNEYVRANMMMSAPVTKLWNILSAMKENYGIMPNLTSYNLLLKAMTRFSDVESAEILLDMMIWAKEFFPHPDEESYGLVIPMLLERDRMVDALIYISRYFKSGCMMSRDLFTECVRYCHMHRRVNVLNSIIRRCKEWDQDLSPNWLTCCHILDMASEDHNSELAYFSVGFIDKWIIKCEKEGGNFSLPWPLPVNMLQIAMKTCSNKLVDGAWSIVERSLGQKKVPSIYYIEKISAYASMRNFEKAFATLHALESLYGGTNRQGEPPDLFSPFSHLHPLVLGCSWNGSDTLDDVYYRLEAWSKEIPPYKSVAALNCIIVGCANIWDDIRAEETFKAIRTEFGLTPDIDSYNGLICAFGKRKRREEALKLFEHFKGLGIKPNEKTYELLVDAHLIARDPKSALSVIDEMEISKFKPTKEILKKVRRRCVREMDTESADQVEALAKKHEIYMPTENRHNLLFNPLEPYFVRY